MTLFLFLACNPGPDADSGDPVPDAETGDTAADSAESAPEPQGAWTAAGHLTGTLSFAVSPAGDEGPAACTYRREFDGIELVGLTDYACPDCKVVFEGEVTVPAEDRACFDAWFPHWTGVTADRREYWGFSRSDFFRGAYPFPSAAGSTDFASPEASVEAAFSYETSSSGAADALLSVTGTLLVEGGPEVPDPQPAARESYLCGWPTGSEGTLAQPASISVGGVIPELPMVDGCGEPLALRDLTGEWVVFVAAVSDCPACVQTALELHDWAATASAPVRVVTVFDGDDSAFAAAQAEYGAIGPVLRSRGYAEVMAWSLVYAAEPASAWWLVDPAQVVRAQGLGTTTDFSMLNEVM